MDADVVRRLRVPAGRTLMARARELVGAGRDELAVLTDLRRDADAELAGAALLQARLASAAAEKFGADANQVVVLPDSLEQATRREVAEHRASVAWERGVRRIVDAGAGLGADTIAMARAGIEVLAIEQQPDVAEALRANVEAVELDARVQVVEGDARELLARLDSSWAVFADPARRRDGRRIFDPEEADPPLSWLVEVANGGRAVIAKMSPSLDGSDVPVGWEAAWTSTGTSGGRSVVEASLWSPPLARVERRAVVLGTTTYSLDGRADDDLPVGEVSSYIYEPDGAVNQAELVSGLLDATGGHLLSPAIGYFAADELVLDLPARAYEVLEEVPWSRRKVGAALSRHTARDLIVKKRGLDLDPAELRRAWLPKLAAREGEPLAVIVVRRARDTIAVVTRPIATA